MSAAALVILYGLLIALVSVGGGLVPLLVRLTHQRMQLALSFVAGAMLGVGLLHLLPHALLELDSIDRVAFWTLGGFLVMFFIERFFAYHHHDISEDEPLDSAQVVATHAEKHPRDHQPHSGGLLSRQLSWTGAAIGLSLHSLADGLALAASIEAEHAGARPVALAGLGTFLVVFLHKPFDAMTLGTLLAAANRPRRVRILINVFFALLVPLGAALCIAGIDTRSDHAGAILGAALAFSAGTFLCIASSDLLPELQFHHHDRGKLSAALLLGIATAWAIGLFEAPGHVHGDNHPPDAHRHEATRPAER